MISLSSDWNGIPPPYKYHFLRRKYDHSIEFFIFNKDEKYPWERKDSGLRIGYTLNDIAFSWEYVSSLVEII